MDEPSDIREQRVDEIVRLLRLYAGKHSVQIKELGQDVEDFVQDVCVNLFRRSGLDTYLEAKCRSFEALIFSCAQRELIDKSRAKYKAKSRLWVDGKPFVMVSLASPLGEDFTVGDTLMSPEGHESLLMEMLEEVPEEQISPNYALSWRELFQRSIAEGPEEIAGSLGISPSRIVQLQKELLSRYLVKPVDRTRKYGNSQGIGGSSEADGSMRELQHPPSEKAPGHKELCGAQVLSWGP